jgi:GAF domain-containing protein
MSGTNDEVGGIEDTRERDIIRAFVDLSNELVDEYDVLDMLARLTDNCAGLLDVAAAGLLLADARGVLHLVASSSERAHHLEVLQLQRDEGPCLDCFHSREAVVVPDLASEEERWPHFVRAASSVGFRSVHAFPMRLHGAVLGTLGLFGDETGRQEDDDQAQAQALVHVPSVAIVNEKAAPDRTTINAQLQRALTSRIVVEQAKGVIAQIGGLTMDEAFSVLRRYARDHARKLSDVAADVVARDLPGQAILDHAGVTSETD